MNQPVKTISVSEFIAQQQNNGAAVIDVRTTAEVNNEYYQGSHNIPLQDITVQKVSDYMAGRGCSDGDPIYILCGSGQRAQKAVTQLVGDIDNPLLVVDGGVNAIKRAGYALKRGSSNVMSLERQVRIAAGSLVLAGVVLGASVNPLCYLLSAFVGAGLVFAGITDTCGMGMLLARMPWNRAG